MSLLFFDGFDFLSSEAMYAKYDSTDGAYHRSGYGRDGGGGLDSYHQECVKVFENTDDTIIAGMANRLEGATTFFWLGTDGVYPVTLQLYGTYALRLTVGGNTYTSADNLWFWNVWKYVEIKVYYHATEGTCEVRLDGEVIFNETGLNTTGSGAVANCFKIGTKQGVYKSGRMDDFYLLNSEGTVANDFLGDIVVKPMYPAADGSVSDFEPSTPGDHFAMLNSAFTDTSTYVSSSNVGDKELFSMDPAISSEEIFGIQVTTVNQKLSGGTVTTRSLMKSGTVPTETEGETIYASSSLKGDSKVYTKEPIDDVPWTSTIIDACEFGIKVHSY